MDLLINTYGTRIRATSERIVFHLPKEKEKREYPVRHIEKIVIMCASSISSDAVNLALKNDVDIVYLNSYGKPVGRIFPSTPKGIGDLRRAQLTFTGSKESILLARRIVLGKTKNQQDFLKFLQQCLGKGLSSHITQMEVTMRKLAKFPKTKLDRNILLGFEGYCAERYFNGLQQLYSFPGRQTQGGDKFNSCLNYGYGILYNEIERACQHVGLDPHLGIYHCERYGKPSFVLDLIEEFRVPVVDSVIVPLYLNKELIKETNYNKKDGKYLLSKKGKETVAKAIYARLNEKIEWCGRQIDLKDIFESQVRAIGKIFTGTTESYTPFSLSNITSFTHYE